MACVNEVLDHVEQLPSLPSSASLLISVLMNGTTDVGEIHKIIKHDEAIALMVLRYANSARYGRPGRAFSLKESIPRLGTKLLMKIALQQQVSQAFVSGADSAYGLRRGSLWRGALAGAIAAEEIARGSEFPEAELCFVCALLRDVGKLILDRYAEPCDIVMAGDQLQSNHCFLEAERETFGFDHAEIGAELARRWGLPERMVQAIRHHHDPPLADAEHDLLFDIVHAADVMCLWTGIATGYDGLQYPLAPHVRERLLGNRAQAEHYMAVMWNKLTEVESEMTDSLTQGMSA